MKTKQWLGPWMGGNMTCPLGVVIAVLLLGGRGQAAPAPTATWYGSVSTAWNNPTNWTPSWQIPGSIQTVPTAATTVTIPAGDAIYPVLTNNVTIAGLSIIQGGGSFTVTNSTLTVGSGGITALTGSTFNVNTGGNIVSTGTVVIGGNCTVNGSVTAPVTVYNTATFTINSNATVNTVVGGFNANSGGGNVNIYGTLNDGTNTLNDNTTISVAGGTFITGPIALLNVNLAVTGGKLTCGGITFDDGGTLTVNGASTVISTGPWNFFGGYTTINSGTFYYSGGTQSIPAGTYSNLSLSGGGTLTLTGGSVSGNFSVDSNTLAGLTSGLNVRVGTLTLGATGEPSGTWGATNSAAANKNSNYFYGPGLVTVSNSAALQPTSTTLGALTTTTYGNSSVWTATVAPVPTTGTVQFQTNGVAIGGAVSLTAGKAATTNSLMAGNYTVTAVYSATSGYASSTSAAATQTVSRVAVTVASGITANSKVYDGTSAGTISSNNVVLSGVLAGDAGNVFLATNNYSATFATANVTNGAAVVMDRLSLTGPAAANYQLTQPTGLTANITPAPVNIAAGITASAKVYSGTTTATISSNNVVLSGVLAGDSANVVLKTNGYTATFASAGVSNSVAVSVSGLTLTGSAAGNYTLAQPTGLTAGITPATVTVTAGIVASGKIYNGTTTATVSSNNVVLSGVLAGDSGKVALVTNGYSATFASAGVSNNVAVTVSGLTLTGSAAANYTLTQPAGLTANITAASVSIAAGITVNNKVYNGTTAASIISNNVVLSGVLAGDTANVTLATNGYSATFASAGVSNNVAVTVSGLTLTGSAAANYTLTQPTGLTGNITAAAVTITAGLTANNKIYNGTTAASISSNNVVLSGVLAGDTANVTLATNSYSATFASAGVSNNVAVTVSGLTLTGSAAGNYSLTQPTGLAASITPATVTIAAGITANNKAYDTTAMATLSSNNVVLSGVLAGDAANVALATNGYTATFASATVANGITVTVGGLTLTGSAAGNYTLTPPAGLTANITPVSVTVLAGITANDKVYDGSMAATITTNNIVLGGVLAGDTANVSLAAGTYVATFASANVQSNQAVTVSGLTLVGSAASNYTLIQPAGLTASITTAPWAITYTNLVNPLATAGTAAWAIDGTNIVGNYTDGTGNHGFLDQGGNFSSVNDPLASSAGTSPRGISGNKVVGQYYAGATTTTACGFIYNITTATFTTLNDPLGTNGSYAMGIEATNIVGYFNNSTGSHGYLYNGSSFLTLNDPLANNITYPRAISGNIVAGYYADAAGLNHGFLYNTTNGTYTTMDDPQATRGTFVRSIWGNFVVGYYTDGLGNHGFLFNGSNYITLNHPADPTNTFITGISGGTVVGYYADATGNHAFSANVTSALPPPAPTSTTVTPPVAVTYGTGVVWTATVSPTPAGGTIQFTTNGTPAGSAVALTAGAATYTNTLLSAGTINVAAIYSGTVLAAASTSTVVAQAVNPATVTITGGVTANGKVYDGTTAATLTFGTPVLNGVLPGDAGKVQLATASYLASYADANVGTGISVSVTGLSLNGSAAANYTLTQPNSLTANITAAPVTVAAGVTANNKAYDGTTVTSLMISNPVLNGVRASDTGVVTLANSGYTANFATANPGNGIAVNVSGLTLTGSAAADYVLTQPTGLTANITRATLLIGSPANNAVIIANSPTVTLTGNTAGNALLTGVWASLDGKTWTAGTSVNSFLNWSVTLPVTAGSQTAKVYAQDVAGNNYATNTVNFTIVHTSPLSLTINGNGIINPNLNGQVLNIGQNYSVAAAGQSGWVFTNWTSNLLPTSGNAALTFSMASNLTLTANFVNVTRPTVQVTSPTAGQQIIGNTPTITVSGLAGANPAGGVSVATVWLSLDGITWTNATLAGPGTSWSAVLPVNPGTQALQAYAVDSTGLASLTNTVSFKVIHTSVLTVATTGTGSVNPNLNGQVLNVGQNYALAAVPGASWRFTNWTSNLLPVTNTANLNFTMASNLTLTANFAYAVNPVLTVTALTNKQVVLTNDNFTTVKGVTASKVAINGVWVTIGTNDWALADTTNGWATWSTVQPIATGPQTMKAYALDIYGNNSGTNVINFTIARTAYMTVITNGNGTIWHNWDNQNLQVGGVFTMTATGRKGWTFLNWTSNQQPAGQNLGTNATLTFTMTTNLVITGNFVDLSQPTVTLPILPAGVHTETNQAPFVINGGTLSAADDSLVTNVWVSFNNGPWQNAVTANNWTNWTLAVNPVRGATNTIQAYAVDAIGNISPTNSTYFYYVQILPVTVLTNQFGTGFGSVSLTTNGQPLMVGNTYYIKAQPAAGCVFSNWTSNLLPPNSAQTFLFTFASNLVLSANFVDITRPTLAVTGVTDGQTVTNSSFNVLGTAADNCAVAQVRYAINSNVWQNASGTTNWSFAASLNPGLNTVQVYSVDPAGNGSVTNLFHLNYAVTAALTLRTNGLGTIAGQSGTYYLGRTYTLSATAAAGFAFTNWTSNQGLNSKSASLQFTMTTNLVLTANFVNTQAPAVTITTPATTRVTNSVFPLAGTASDNWGLSGVYCQVNGGAWVLASTANGYTNWNASLNLSGGTNVINVQAVDLGNPTPRYSPVKSVTIVLLAAPFNLQNLRATVAPDDGTPSFELNFAATTFAAYAWSTNLYDAAGSFTYTNPAPDRGVLFLQASALPQNVYQQTVTLAFTNRYVARLNYTNGSGQLVGATAVFTTISNITPNALIGKTMRFVNAQGQNGAWSFSYNNRMTQTVGTQLQTNAWTYQAYGPCAALLTMTGAGKTNWCLFHYETAEAAEYYNGGSDGSEDYGTAGFDDTATGTNGVAPASVNNHTLLLNLGLTLGAVTCTGSQFAFITSDNSAYGSGNYTYGLVTTNTASLILNYTNPGYTNTETHIIGFLNPSFGVTTNSGSVSGVIVQ